MFAWISPHFNQAKITHILLLESPCPLVRWFVGSSVTFFTLSDAHDISATKRATGDPLVSKRPDFRGLFGFSKKITFWMSGFLDFWIFWEFWLYLGNGKSYDFFWICWRNFLDLSTKFFGFVEKNLGFVDENKQCANDTIQWPHHCVGHTAWAPVGREGRSQEARRASN